MPKLLGEFLQEQQEPFILDVYLLERGYCARARPPHDSAARLLNIRSTRCSKKKRRPAIPNCAELVRSVFTRILIHNHTRKKIKNSAEANEDGDDDFSSASATTLYNSCSDIQSDVENVECIINTEQYSDSSRDEAEADHTIFLDMRSMGDGDEDKQLSPISVLEETDQSEASSLHQKQYKFKKTKGESSSKLISQRKSVQNFEECMNQYSINKRALQQTKKLLVDCVREVIERERKRDDESGQRLKKILGADELWKFVCENVWLWSQESIHQNNTLHLVHCDFMASFQDLNSASHQIEHELSMEIGDAILEDIINEIVTNC